MKNLNFLFAMLLAITVIFYISCSDKENSYDETLVVASENVKTTEGIAYRVKTSKENNWRLMHQGIYNFNYESGYEYVIKVRFYKNENPGPDQPVSEPVGLRKHLFVDGLVAKAEVFGLLTMCDCNICEFPQASASNELAKHQNQQMVPVRHRPAFGSVVVLGEYSPELPLREELYCLCENEYSSMHICSDFESDAKVSISKPGQGIAGLKRCA